MEILRQHALRGINIWTHATAIQALIKLDLVDMDLAHSDKIIRYLQSHWPLSTLQTSVNAIPVCTLAHTLTLVVLELQVQAGCLIRFSHTQATSDPAIFKLVVEYSEEAVGLLAFHHAVLLCQSILLDKPYPIDAAVQALHELNEDIRMGPSTASIVHAAAKRGIPYYRLTEGSLVQFGWGSQQRRIRGSEINTTGNIAEEIAQDKELTRKFLTAAGIPTPIGCSVETVDEAWRAACEIGLPVVLKPRSGNQGRGVTVNVKTQEELIEAYHYAQKIEDTILVEQYIPGSDYRLLVVGDRMVAAARRCPPMVIGDDVHTIGELIAIINQDPRRSAGHAMPMSRILVDALVLENLAVNGYTLDSRLPKGESVILRHNANLSSGGSATDVTDEVHPELALLAVEAAQTIGLNPCGIDFVCEDIQMPLSLQRGAVIELNASPGLRMHLSPSYGKARLVGEDIIQDVFGASEDGRIPVIAVTGTNDKTTTVRLITHLLTSTGFRVGMTNSDGVYVNGNMIDDGDCSGPKSARKILHHPDVDAAVFETARGGILREGLAFDACQVAVVTNIGTGDHLGMDYINTIDELALIKQTVISSLADNGSAVLNAADPMVAAMASHCRGSIIFFAMDKNITPMLTHLAQGGRGIYVEDNSLVAAVGESQHRIPLAHVPLTLNGTIGFQIENVMAAVAAVWAVGLAWDDIAKGLHVFTSDPSHTPGRFNLFTYREARVIVDYGHNPDAMRVLVKAIETMPAKKRVLVISGAGDRQDSDIIKMTEILAATFDIVFLYQDQCQRGRSDGEVLELLSQGLVAAKRAAVIEKIYGEIAAIERALSCLEAGDLCLILVDQVDVSINYIIDEINAAEVIG